MSFKLIRRTTLFFDEIHNMFGPPELVQFPRKNTRVNQHRVAELVHHVDRKGCLSPCLHYNCGHATAISAFSLRGF